MLNMFFSHVCGLMCVWFQGPCVHCLYLDDSKCPDGTVELVILSLQICLECFPHV